jgi:hypothetical protein
MVEMQNNNYFRAKGFHSGGFYDSVLVCDNVFARLVL